MFVPDSSEGVWPETVKEAQSKTVEAMSDDQIKRIIQVHAQTELENRLAVTFYSADQDKMVRAIHIWPRHAE